MHTKSQPSAWSPSPSKTVSSRASSRSTRAPSPQTTWRERRWKSCSESEMRGRTTTNGCRTSRWPLAGKKIRSNSSTPFGYESCCRYPIDVQTGEFKAKKETELAVSDKIRASTRFWSPSGPFLRSSAPVPKSQRRVLKWHSWQPSTAWQSGSLLRASRRPGSQKTPNSCSGQWGR